MPSTLLHNKLKSVIELVISVGNEVLKISRNPTDNKDILLKHDGSPVTITDKFVSHKLIEGISRIFPKDTVLSEEDETNHNNETSQNIWFIDPIDGTKGFIDRNNEWTILVGLAQHNKPIFGIICQPTEGKIYFGGEAYGGAFLETMGLERKILKISQNKEISDFILAHSKNHFDIKIYDLAKQIGITKFLPIGSIGLKHGLIAEGIADSYINIGGKCHFWDLCAGDAILQSAGASLRYFNGDKINYTASKEAINRSVFVSSNSSIKALVAILS